MKYIKLFESDSDSDKNYIIVYNAGDYVKLKTIPDYTKIQIDETDKTNLFAKILTRQYVDLHIPDMYEFELTNKKVIWAYVHLIRRRLNKKEIETYLMKKTANEYNL